MAKTQKAGMSRKGWVCYKLSQKQLEALKEGREVLKEKRKAKSATASTTKRKQAKKPSVFGRKPQGFRTIAKRKRTTKRSR